MHDMNVCAFTNIKEPVAAPLFVVEEHTDLPQVNAKSHDVGTSPMRPSPVEDGPSGDKEKDDNVASSKAQDVDPMKCRECGKGGESKEWVGCENCDFWVHLSCIGVCVVQGTNMKLLLQKFKYQCPQHRKAK